MIGAGGRCGNWIHTEVPRLRPAPAGEIHHTRRRLSPAGASVAVRHLAVQHHAEATAAVAVDRRTPDRRLRIVDEQRIRVLGESN
jgi:hypothetical protein